MQKLHHEFGIRIQKNTDVVTLRNLLRQHRAVVIDNVHFDKISNFQNWLDQIGAVSPGGNNSHADLRLAYGEQHDQAIKVVQHDPGLPNGGMYYLDTQGTGYWHQDGVNYDRGNECYTALYSVITPDTGGDTCIADLHLAWNDLSDEYKNMLRPLHTVNGNRAFRLWNEQYFKRYPERFANELAAFEKQRPLVTIDSFGREGLNFSPKNVISIAGMHIEESAPIIEFLSCHVSRLEYQYRHKWQANQVFFFSDESMIHYAIRDYRDSPRELWSCKINAGDNLLDK